MKIKAIIKTIQISLFILLLSFFIFEMCNTSFRNKEYLKEIRSISSKNINNIKIYKTSNSSFSSIINIENYKNIKIIENRDIISNIIYSLYGVKQLSKPNIGNYNNYLILINTKLKMYLFYYSNTNLTNNKSGIIYFIENRKNEFKKTELFLMDNELRPFLKSLNLPNWKEK